MKYWKDMFYVIQEKYRIYFNIHHIDKHCVLDSLIELSNRGEIIWANITGVRIPGNIISNWRCKYKI